MKQIECNNSFCSNMVKAPQGVTVVCCSCIMAVTLQIQKEQENQIHQMKKTKTTAPVHKRKRWTPKEDNILTDNVKEKNILELMNILPGRTGYAIENRIFKLKIDHIAKQKYVDQGI